MNRSRRNRKLRTSNRRGATVTEFAVCLPILLLFFFGLWEYSRMEIVRQSVKAAALSGAREGMVDGATAAEMEAAAAQVLQGFNIRGANIESQISGEVAELFISVPLVQNSFAASIFSRDAEAAYRIRLRRESFEG